MAVPTLVADLPLTGSPMRERVLDALNAMVTTAQEQPLNFSAVEGAGLMVRLQHERVHCILVIELAEPVSTLTPRELEIARLIARGATNRAVASVLDISSWTVSTHLRRVFAKLGVSSRAEMVNQLFGTPLVPIPEVASAERH